MMGCMTNCRSCEGRRAWVIDRGLGLLVVVDIGLSGLLGSGSGLGIINGTVLVSRSDDDDDGSLHLEMDTPRV